MTKHSKIIDYIRELKPGTRISVRKIAQDLGVSEGTAYRAIKEAENIKIVSTSPRIGTVRIEDHDKKPIEKLTYDEIVNIVDGTVLGGMEGLYRALNKFVIGAMTVDEMEKYLSAGDVVIVGNREDAQRKALERDCAVLISGGFGCSDEIKCLGNAKGLPVISSSYDTFTIAALINNALSEKLVKKDIVLVEDILVENPDYMKASDLVGNWKNMVLKTGHSRFPVVNDKGKIVGIVTGKDIVNVNNDEPISKIMTRNPITISPEMPVAYASQLMVWEGIELIPVEKNGKLIGVVSRQDVIKALQYMKNQPQIGQRVEDSIMSGFNAESTGNGIRLRGSISKLMVNQYGTVSCGSLSVLMLFAASEAVRKHRNYEILTDSFSVYFIKPAQLDSEIIIEAKLMESGRKNCKIELEAVSGNDIIAKAIISVKVLKK